MTEAAVQAVVESFRLELVRRFGMPWFEDHAHLVDRLALALVATVPDPGRRAELVRRWLDTGFPTLDRWLTELERRAA